MYLQKSSDSNYSVFPTFPSTYDQNSLPERLLCWLPRDGKYVGVTDAATDAIPCILALEPKYLPSEFSST